jgi:hypothetical protein
MKKPEKAKKSVGKETKKKKKNRGQSFLTSLLGTK